MCIRDRDDALLTLPTDYLVWTKARALGVDLILSGSLEPVLVQEFGEDGGARQDGAGVFAVDEESQRVYCLSDKRAVERVVVSEAVPSRLVIAGVTDPESGVIRVPFRTVMEGHAVPQFETPGLRVELFPVVKTLQRDYLEGVVVDPGQGVA